MIVGVVSNDFKRGRRARPWAWVGTQIPLSTSLFKCPDKNVVTHGRDKTV